jgi:hypothetical protein
MCGQQKLQAKIIHGIRIQLGFSTVLIAQNIAITEQSQATEYALQPMGITATRVVCNGLQWPYLYGF